MRRIIWGALALCLFASPAQADFEFTDIACETSTTAGTGTLDLDGALTGGYLGFAAAGIDSGDTVPYHIKNGSQLETGIGTFTDAAPDTLSRTAFLSTDGSGAELTLSGSSTICIGPITQIYTAGVARFTLDSFKIDGDDGGTTYGGIASQFITETTNPTGVWSWAAAAYSADVGAGSIGFFKSRNATPESHTVVQSGDNLGFFQGYGSDGTNFECAATVMFQVDGTPGDNDMPGRIVFRTTPDGSTTCTNQWIIDNAGTLKPATDNADDIGTATLGVKDVYVTNNLEMGGDTSNSVNCTGGECTIEGDKLKQAGKQTIWVPAGAMTTAASNGCTGADTAINTITLPTKACDQTTSESVYFSVAFPKNWNEGTVTAQLFWTSGGTPASETIEIEVSCGTFVNDAAINVSGLGTAVALTDTGIAANDLHVTAEGSAITCSNAAVDGVTWFRLVRDVANDNLAEDLLIVGLKVFFTDDDANDD